MKKLFTISLLLACLLSSLKADIIAVPGDQPSIQEGIDAASEGDTVLVADSTYYENINFKGKAITVASYFLLHGDTSHISKTVIDGSQATDPNVASTVTMNSGEDTTSVLTGFTITGGKGTIQFPWSGYKLRMGGGINIVRAGGKIVHNIIENNHLGTGCHNGGGGISAWGDLEHVILIRDNIIRNNSCTTNKALVYAGGAILIDGTIFFESNQIYGNTITSTETGAGAGLFWGGSDFNTSENMAYVYILKNMIHHNKVDVSQEGAGGGGIGVGVGSSRTFEITNNLIYENICTAGKGGGIFLMRRNAAIFNNTVCNNLAPGQGRNLFLNQQGILLFNNIVWSENEDGNSNCYFSQKYQENDPLFAFNNILSEPIETNSRVESTNNLFLDPLFEPGSYEPSEFSPAIGRALDSVYILDTCIYAPDRDIAGHLRPDPVDSFPDIGAYESEYGPAPLSVADLDYIGFHDYELSPAFHRDSLDYLVKVHDTVTSAEALEARPTDMFAYVDFDYPTDIGAPNPENRNAKLTVTSSDSSTKEVYSVLFDFMSSDATLDTLYVVGYDLSPAFHPDTLYYSLELPTDPCIVPEVIYESTSPFATANSGADPDRNNLSESMRTLKILVQSEDKTNYRSYKILYNLCVGINDRAPINKFRIYPNPVNASLSIETDRPGMHSVDIYSISGQLIYSTKDEGPTLQIDLSSFRKGIYFLTVKTREYIRTEKIIKY